MDNRLLISVVVFSAIIAIVTGVVYFRPVAVTKQAIASEMRHGVLATERPSGELSTVDGWGRPLVYEVDVTEERIVHVVASAGRDGKFGTDDDIVETKQDLNKSRLAGRYAKSRFKEFVKGWKESKDTRHSREGKKE